MKRSALKNLRLYPHFKLTNEKFPRLLATRRIDRDGSEYFGAFLPETGARVLLGFINRVFKLRSCAVEIDNGLALPCPMFYSKRCLAPCIENICDQKKYLERVELLRLFLADRRSDLRQVLTMKIEACSDKMEFENAAEWHQLLIAVESLWDNGRRQYWIDTAVDTWEIVEDDTQHIFNLVTQKGRRILGSRVFIFEKTGDERVGEIAEKVFLRFYRIHVPKEIRVFKEFDGRKKIAKTLSKRFGKHVKIVIQCDLTPTTKKGLTQLRFASAIKNVASSRSLKNLQMNLKKDIKLKRIPNRIEAYDVAHTTGEYVVTSRVVWEKGQFLIDQNDVWRFDGASEPQAITEAIRSRFENTEANPDLIMIDGGKSQLNAALRGVSEDFERDFKFISAVKPQGKHHQISHFLDERLNRIEIADRDTFSFLTNLRDRAHDLANLTHGRARDKNNFYALAMVLPTFGEMQRREFLKTAGSIQLLRESKLQQLQSIFGADTAARIVQERRSGVDAKGRVLETLIPIRFDAEGGDAQDLQPISPRERH